MSKIIDVGAGLQNRGGRFSRLKRAFGPLFLLAALVTGCGSISAQSCPAGLAPMTTVDLFFGLSMPSGGEVDAAAWQRFVDEEITPRFPDGLTVEDALGQWKGTTAPVQERAKHVIIVLTDNAFAKLAAIRAAYKNRFHQQSVLLTQSQVCGSF